MKIETQFDLTNFNSYKLFSICSKAYFPKSEDDLLKIFESSKSFKKYVIGGGFNIILSKEYYEEEFIIISENFSKIKVNETEITAQAGASLEALSVFALQNSLTGLEIFYDIPSSLGGAVVMNAGASGEEIKDLLVNVRCLDLSTSKFYSIEKEEMDFAYRNSIFQKNPNLIITEAKLKLGKGDKSLIESKMTSIKASRWAKQPKGFPNAGSVFKRPNGYYIGAIIDELNLKGFSVGGAKISEKHGGFIINYNNAKGKDIIAIIEEVKELVFKKYNIDLEIEQRIL